MKMTTVRGVIGDPQQWSNCISDASEPMPEINGSKILHIFVTAHEVALHLRGETGTETLSRFEIRDPTVRKNLVEALQPGRKIQEVLDSPIQSE